MSIDRAHFARMTLALLTGNPEVMRAQGRCPDRFRFAIRELSVKTSPLGKPVGQMRPDVNNARYAA